MKRIRLWSWSWDIIVIEISSNEAHHLSKIIALPVLWHSCFSSGPVRDLSRKVTRCMGVVGKIFESLYELE